jgi:hypothetical protein
MRRRTFAALCAAALASMAVLSFAATQGGPDPRAHTTIKDLMVSLIDPSADDLWNAVGTVVDKDEGTIERIPDTDEEWLDVRSAAVRIIEGANLLMIPGREAAPPGTKSETPGVELEPTEITALINRNRGGFDRHAVALRTLGWEALQVSEAKNADMLLDVGGRIQEVCESCHQAFWYPNATAPQSASEQAGR